MPPLRRLARPARGPRALECPRELAETSCTGSEQGLAGLERQGRGGSGRREGGRRPEAPRTGGSLRRGAPHGSRGVSARSDARRDPRSLRLRTRGSSFGRDRGPVRKERGELAGTPARGGAPGSARQALLPAASRARPRSAIRSCRGPGRGPRAAGSRAAELQLRRL